MTDDVLDRAARIAKLFGDHDGFDCPHCGHTYEISDSDVCSAVVSYWGEEPHPFSCSACDKDFLVKERVIRQFEAAKEDDEW